MHPWPSPHVPVLPGHGPALRLYEGRLRQAMTTGGPARGTLALCGPVLSGGLHLGQAATAVAADLVLRAWLDAGFEVTSVQHIAHVGGTDHHAGDGGADDAYAAFALDLTALGVIPPDHLVAPGDVAPVVERMPADVAASGAGRGGTPLGTATADEGLICAAAILDRLGGACDVLCGGPDLPPRHLAATTALLRTATGEDRPVQRVMAPAGVTLDDGPVGEGDARTATTTAPVRIADLLSEGASPLAVRLLVLSHHYRSPWVYARGELEEATQRLRRWTAAVSGNGGPPVEDLLARVRADLADDLDTPRALAAVDAWADLALTAGQPDGIPESDLVEGAPGVAARAVDALLGVRL